MSNLRINLTKIENVTDYATHYRIICYMTVEHTMSDTLFRFEYLNRFSVKGVQEWSTSLM